MLLKILFQQALSTNITGSITGTNIVVTVPYGTDVTALIATFTLSGKSITVGNTVQLSGTTPNNFTHAVKYSVSAKDGTKQEFNITVVFIGFVTKWKTDNTGFSNDNQIILPLDKDGTYNFTLNWGDGKKDTITSYNQAEITHTYTQTGTYTVTMNGTIEGFGFSKTAGDEEKLTDIKNWGSVKLHNKGFQFTKIKLKTFSATDTPDLSNITNMSAMFYDAQVFNGNICNWDVSKVENMAGMFWAAYLFNQDIGSWDVSSVKNMSALFYNVVDFNMDLSHWNVSNVTIMNKMFTYAIAFNSDISSWNVSKVTEMESMFSSTPAFSNHDLSGWNVSKVTKHTDFSKGWGSGNTEPNWK